MLRQILHLSDSLVGLLVRLSDVSLCNSLSLALYTFFHPGPTSKLHFGIGFAATGHRTFSLGSMISPGFGTR